jgi:hypothetical protein
MKKKWKPDTKYKINVDGMDDVSSNFIADFETIKDNKTIIIKRNGRKNPSSNNTGLF